jgi:hypothetical protein
MIIWIDHHEYSEGQEDLFCPCCMKLLECGDECLYVELANECGADYLIHTKCLRTEFDLSVLK